MFLLLHLVQKSPQNSDYVESPEIETLSPDDLMELITNNASDGKSHPPMQSLLPDAAERGLRQQMEVAHKLANPLRLHPDIWHNEEGEHNNGPACSCKPKYRIGPLHKQYEGEEAIPPCDPESNNRDRLHHYRVMVNPTTNFFNLKPTTIRHDGHDYLFDGFSIFLHSPLEQLPPCQLLRFNLLYDFVAVEEEFPQNFTVRSLDMLTDYIFRDLLELLDLNWRPAGVTTGCPVVHLLPRFVRIVQTTAAGPTAEILSVNAILEHWMRQTELPVIDALELAAIQKMSDAEWSDYIHDLRGTLAWYPGKLANELDMMEHSGVHRREITVELSCEGFYRTGIRPDVTQFALNMASFVAHVRFHKSLETLEQRLGYKFKDKSLLHQALTHPSYRRTNFGTNQDHFQNTLVSCGPRTIEYGDKLQLYKAWRKKGLSKMIQVMSFLPKQHEERSKIYGNERLEFLGDAVIEIIASVHLFFMFPDLPEGSLDAYRQALVQNQHLAELALRLGLHKFLLYTHSVDFCYDSTYVYARSDAFEAVMAAIALDAGLDTVDRIFGAVLFGNCPRIHQVWVRLPPHPLQAQFPDGDRQWATSVPMLKKLTQNSISSQPHDQQEQPPTAEVQSASTPALPAGLNAQKQNVKYKADLLEAFIGALYVDKDMTWVERFCQVCFWPRLVEFILKQEWNDAKSKLQQCCLTFRSLNEDPEIAHYKVLDHSGPSNQRIYRVGVFFRGVRLAVGTGRSVQCAQMEAAKVALETHQETFKQLDFQRSVIVRRYKQPYIDKMLNQLETWDEELVDRFVDAPAYGLEDNSKPSSSSSESCTGTAAFQRHKTQNPKRPRLSSPPPPAKSSFTSDGSLCSAGTDNEPRNSDSDMDLEGDSQDDEEKDFTNSDASTATSKSTPVFPSGTLADFLIGHPSLRGSN
nr:unnamed protein product [Spirometra erinaceieuropaei]